MVKDGLIVRFLRKMMRTNADVAVLDETPKTLLCFIVDWLRILLRHDRVTTPAALMMPDLDVSVPHQRWVCLRRSLPESISLHHPDGTVRRLVVEFVRAGHHHDHDLRAMPPRSRTDCMYR